MIMMMVMMISRLSCQKLAATYRYSAGNELLERGENYIAGGEEEKKKRLIIKMFAFAGGVYSLLCKWQGDT